MWLTVVVVIMVVMITSLFRWCAAGGFEFLVASAIVFPLPVVLTRWLLV